MVSLAAVFASCVNFSLNAIDDWSIYVATISVSTSSEETQLINFRSSTGLKLLLFRTNPHPTLRERQASACDGANKSLQDTLHG